VLTSGGSTLEVMKVEIGTATNGGEGLISHVGSGGYGKSVGMGAGKKGVLCETTWPSCGESKGGKGVRGTGESIMG